MPDFSDPKPCIPDIVAPIDGDARCHAFVVQFGRHFIPAPLPKNFRCRAPKECFLNARKLAFAHPELAYVEGVGRRFCGQNYFPVTHAWCVRIDGTVIDSTWIDPAGMEYFGVAFQTSFVREFVRRNKLQLPLIDKNSLSKLSALPETVWRHTLHNVTPFAPKL